MEFISCAVRRRPRGVLNVGDEGQRLGGECDLKKGEAWVKRMGSPGGLCEESNDHQSRGERVKSCSAHTLSFRINSSAFLALWVQLSYVALLTALPSYSA